ncbi:MAG: anti-sigma factor [Cyanobacteria bacterium P01_C01_bin.120]
MDSPEHPSKLHELLAGYALQNLTPTEVAQVERLIANDPAVAAELQKLQSTLSVLPLSLSQSSPSPALKRQILQAARVDCRTDARPRQRFSGPLAKWFAIGSAATIVIGLGHEVTTIRRQLAATQLENQQLQEQLASAQATLQQIRQQDLRQTRQELSRYQAAVNLLREPDNRYLTLQGRAPEMPTTGSLVIVPNQASAILVLRDVTTLPSDRVYRIWAVVDGQKVACGDFLPNDEGNVFQQLPLDEWGETPEVVITIEPKQENPEPLGEMVIFGS